MRRGERSTASATAGLVTRTSRTSVGSSMIAERPRGSVRDCEVGPENVGSGGVVRDESVREQAITAVAEAAKVIGFEVVACADAAIKGPKGNHEAFLHLC